METTSCPIERPRERPRRRLHVRHDRRLALAQVHRDLTLLLLDNDAVAAALELEGARDRVGIAHLIVALSTARPMPAPTVVSEVWLLAALGDMNAAFDVLARAEDERQPYLPFTGLPGFDPLRADPRFGALLERLGLPSAA